MGFSDEDRAAFKRGECPGCGGSILRLAEERADWHYVPGAVVQIGSPSDAHDAGYEGETVHVGGGRYQQTMVGGEPIRSLGMGLAGGDSRVCRWTTDRLYSLQLVIGWGEGKSMLADHHYAS